MLPFFMKGKVMVKIEQSKLDEMNNHIAELHTIISYHFDELPYKVQRK